MFCSDSPTADTRTERGSYARGGQQAPHISDLSPELLTCRPTFATRPWAKKENLLFCRTSKHIFCLELLRGGGKGREGGKGTRSKNIFLEIGPWSRQRTVGQEHEENLRLYFPSRANGATTNAYIFCGKSIQCNHNHPTLTGRSFASCWPQHACRWPHTSARRPRRKAARCFREGSG